MTLNDLWIEFGGEPEADMPLVIDVEGLCHADVKGVGPFTEKDGKEVLIITNVKGS